MDLVELVLELGRPQGGLVSAAQLRRAGVSRNRLSRAVAAGALLRVRPQVYALAVLPPRPRFVVAADGVDPAYVQHVRAALLQLGPTAVAAGRTAAALYGWPLLVEPSRTIEVAVPHGRSRTSASCVRVTRHRALPRAELVLADGAAPVPVTTPARTLLDVAAQRPLLEAVVCADSALRAGHATVETLQLVASAATPSARRMLAHCAHDSGSVPETVLRVGLVRAGLVPHTQHVVRDGHRHVLRADFCFPAARLVVEVDGARWHADAARDRHTDNLLAALGWRVMRFSGVEVLRDTGSVVDRIRAATGAAGGTPSTHQGPVVRRGAA